MVGWDGLYEVSDDGLIRSVERLLSRPHPKNPAKMQTRRYGGKEIRPKVNRNGYVEVALWKNNAQHFKLLHRLVAEAFCEGAGEQVNHKDGDKSNNAASNLEWVTCSENHRHAYRVLGRKIPWSGAQAKSFLERTCRA